jgi:hypothetical protein
MAGHLPVRSIIAIRSRQDKIHHSRLGIDVSAIDTPRSRDADVLRVMGIEEAVGKVGMSPILDPLAAVDFRRQIIAPVQLRSSGTEYRPLGKEDGDIAPEFDGVDAELPGRKLYAAAALFGGLPDEFVQDLRILRSVAQGREPRGTGALHVSVMGYKGSLGKIRTCCDLHMNILLI